ncbi:MAG: response regulator [Candidatus Methanoperedens sp.]|nr:response regulator [Candidatus Methanoperedens sp.]
MTKILVVEDIPLNMEFLLEILKLQGFDVDGAKDGEEAIQKAEKGIYDLIIMDIALPGIDGFEAFKIIKSMPSYKIVPVIALTAYAMTGDRERILKAGFDAYASKPLDVPAFLKILEKYKGKV